MNSTNKKNRQFTIGIFHQLSKTNNDDFITKAIPALCENGFNIICIANGDNDKIKECITLSNKYKEQFKILEDNKTNQEKLYKNSNIAIFPGEIDKKLLKKVMNQGIIPILEEENGLKTFNAETESGCAFTFEKNNFWQFLFAIMRSSINHEFTYDWKTIKKNIEEEIHNS